MAKRRKMTLFDVINTSQPLGLQVKDRSAANRAEARRPLDRSGGLMTAPTRGGKLTAAEELAILRRELGAKSVAATIDEPADEPADPHRAEHAARAIPLEPEATATIVAPRAPGPPRKPIAQNVREAWGAVAPKLNTVSAATARGARAAGRGAASAANASWQRASRLRDVDTRYLMTGAVIASAIVLLSGTFYVGRLLARRPADAITDVANVDLSQTRPDVLNLNARGNEANANLFNRVDAKLERQADPTRPTPHGNPAIFGGRDVSMNYVVVARYDTAIDADAAVDVLARYGVKATVERNLPHWEKDSGRDRFYVVGTEGFARVSGPTYASYLNTLGKVSDKEAGNNLPAKLSPAPYKFQRS